MRVMVDHGVTDPVVVRHSCHLHTFVVRHSSMFTSCYNQSLKALNGSSRSKKVCTTYLFIFIAPFLPPPMQLLHSELWHRGIH
jgi:hypothetical protein